MSKDKVNSVNDEFGLPLEPAAATQVVDLAAENARLRMELLEAKVAVMQAQTNPPGLFAAAPDDGPDEDLDTRGFPKKYVKITVFRGPNAQDLDYVTPSIGGVVLKITRGEEVIIPTVFAEVLDHCVEDITVKAEGGLVTRPSHRFPYTVHGPATEEEYLAFTSKMRGMSGAVVRPE